MNFVEEKKRDELLLKNAVENRKKNSESEGKQSYKKLKNEWPDTNNGSSKADIEVHIQQVFHRQNICPYQPVFFITNEALNFLPPEL